MGGEDNNNSNNNNNNNYNFNNDNNNNDSLNNNFNVSLDNSNSLITKKSSNDQLFNNSSIGTTDNGSDDYSPALNDKHTNLTIWFTVVMLSVALLFPYSSYLSVLDYFDILYPHYHPTSTIPFVYMAMLIIAFIITLKFSRSVKYHYNIIGGFIVFIIALVIIPCLSLTSISGTLSCYIITVILIGITAFVDGLIQSSVFSIVGLFGSRYMIGAQVGIGLSGVINVAIRIIIKLAFDKDRDSSNKYGILLFFCVGCLLIIVACILFFYLIRLPIVGDIILKKYKLNSNNNNNNNNLEIKSINNSNSNNSLSESESQSKLESESVSQSQSKLKSLQSQSKSLIYVWKNCYHYICCLVLLMFLSLFLFPGFMMQVNVQNVAKDWYMILVVLIYSVFDLIGKIVPFYLNRVNGYSVYLVWGVTLFRFIFVFLFFMSIYHDSFRVDALIYVFIAIFGFSNGFVASICMAQGPEKVIREHKELAGAVMSFSIDIGLLFGSALSLLVSLVQ